MSDKLKRRHTDLLLRRSTDKNDNDTPTQSSMHGLMAESSSEYNHNGKMKNCQQTKIRILLIMRQSIMRFGLASLLGEQPDFQVVGTAGNCAECNKKILQLSAQVLLCDFETANACPLKASTPGGCLSETQHDLLPDIPAILLQDDQHEHEIVQASRIGIRGYLTTDTRLEDLFRAIRVVKDGGTFIEHRVQSKVMGILGQLHNGKQNEKVHLTDRELTMLQLLAQGKRNQDIAKDVFLSNSSVKRYLSKLYVKLGASNRAEAVSIGISKHFISTR